MYRVGCLDPKPYFGYEEPIRTSRVALLAALTDEPPQLLGLDTAWRAW